MFIGKVCGALVATQKDERMAEAKLLLVEAFTADPAQAEPLKPTGRVLVALDSLGAGTGEYVLVTQGSSARMTDMTKTMPVDAVIIGIVDTVRVMNSVLSRSEGTLVS